MNKQIAEVIPAIGIATFVGLYIFSSTLYPGGSQANLNSEGFDWINNYWCNLMNENGMNGLPNPARPYSIAAMAILCFSLTIFFTKFAQTCCRSKIWKGIIIASGIISMGLTSFIFTNDHDLMIKLASIFGLLVIIGVMKELFSRDLIIYRITGIICLIMLGLNNFIYYTQRFIEILPLLQKLSLALVLIWILGLNQEMTKINRKRSITESSKPGNNLIL